MNKMFKIVTEEILDKINCKFYKAGSMLQINDRICFAYINNYASFGGLPPSKYKIDEVSLSLKMFVEKDGLLYELYQKL